MKILKFSWETEYSWGIGKSTTKRIVQRKTEFCFIDKFEEIKMENNSFAVTLSDNIFLKEELLNEYYIKLKFPSYFGFNWDALYDCLAYMENIQQKNVIIYHNALPQLNDNDMKIYLKILKDSSGEWIGMDWCANNHTINIYFSMQDYDKVQQLIG
ncbi:MAG: barstar family protein [Paludibacter sp.]|nr:barstar family protein [Paludibacter sp.]